jgi:hypothetical protein
VCAAACLRARVCVCVCVRVFEKKGVYVDMIVIINTVLTLTLWGGM